MCSNGLKKRLKVRLQFLTLAGDACSRNRIQKSGRGGGYFFHAFCRTGGSNQKYCIEARLAHGSGKVAGFFDRQVRGQDTVKTRGGGVFSQPLQTVLKQWIVVAEQQKGHVRMLPDFG